MKAKFLDQPIHTTASIRGLRRAVTVFCDYQPPEPDVNILESVTITQVMLQGRWGVDITEDLYPQEIDELEIAILELYHNHLDHQRAVHDDMVEEIRREIIEESARQRGAKI
jgi:hypothetical protein